MKQLFFAVLLLTATTITAQEITTTDGDMASVSITEGKSLEKKESSIAKLQLELAALKKENSQLKKELTARELCKQSVHSKLVELDAAKARRQRKKSKINQNILPPPL